MEYHALLDATQVAEVIAVNLEGEEVFPGLLDHAVDFHKFIVVQPSEDGTPLCIIIGERTGSRHDRFDEHRGISKWYADLRRTKEIDPFGFIVKGGGQIRFLNYSYQATGRNVGAKATVCFTGGSGHYGDWSIDDIGPILGALRQAFSTSQAKEKGLLGERPDEGYPLNVKSCENYVYFTVTDRNTGPCRSICNGAQ